MGSFDPACVSSGLLLLFPRTESLQNHDSLLEQAKLKKISSNTLGSAAVTEFHRICLVPKEQTGGYVCQGPEYEAFGDKLEAFVKEE